MTESRVRRNRDSYGHIITAACFSIQAVGIGTYISYGIFFNPLMAAFDWSRAAISGASSTAFFFAGLFGILVGRLNDRVGQFFIPILASLFIAVFALLMAIAQFLYRDQTMNTDPE